LIHVNRKPVDCSRAPRRWAGLVARTAPASTEGQASLAARLEVRFGATPAVVSYSGPAPGLVGIYQFNVVVPDGVLSTSQAYDDRVAVIFELNCKSQAQTLLTTIER